MARQGAWRRIRNLGTALVRKIGEIREAEETRWAEQAGEGAIESGDAARKDDPSCGAAESVPSLTDLVAERQREREHTAHDQP